MTRLEEEDIAGRLASLPEWSIVDGKLHRKFRFADFNEAFGFMSRAALVAESLNHHPEWSNTYNQVWINLTTHDVGGISERDFEFADRLDQFLASQPS